MKDSGFNFKAENTVDKVLADLKILLWDIDGTLMRSTVQGGYKKYFAATMRKVFGSSGTLDDIIPSGMTDTQIMFEALEGEGFTSDQIFERKDEILTVFKSEMSKVLSENGEPYEVLSGAKEILTATDEQRNLFVNALLTGNLSVAAEIKLRSVDLWRFFENAPNAFGEISHERKELAIAAGNLFNESYRFNFRPERFIVIGDTPNDILCARHFGAKVIAVATGRNQTREKLSEYKPDFVVDDLSDTAQILEILRTI